jgi:acetylornithine deacetylase/succinyl-diaminopimelate desuccinylase-like protein
MDIKQKEFLDTFTQYLSLASVGTDPAYDEQTQQAATFLEQLLSKMQFDVQLLETKGKPIVFAQKIVDESKPTALIYGHYDVQPAKKEDGWDTEPFEPTIKDEFLYARGATDNKGPVLAMIHALSLFDEIPMNIKFFIEGEEEIGSKHFEEAVNEYKHLLDADFVMVSDGVAPTNDEPYVTIGLRGLIYAYIRIGGPSQDVHSGLHGGYVANPHQTLCHVLNKLKDHKTGEVLIPTFYDDVAEPNEFAIKASKIIPYSFDLLEQEIGKAPLYVENISDLFLHRWTKPTFEIHGISGGYTDEGAKTIIPAYAEAKVSMRLVANQDPQKIFDAFVSFVQSIEPPQFTNPDSEHMKIASQTLSTHFGKETIYTQSGGSIVAIGVLDRILKKPIISIPSGRIDDGLHSPNERIEIARLCKFIHIFHDIFEKMGEKSIHS